MTRLIAALCVGLALALPAPRADAAASFDGCTGLIDALPATITTAGVWCLDRNLNTAMSSGSAITVAGTSVTIDCNGFRLSGLAAGIGTAARGINAQNRANTTVRDCTLRGFAYGVFLDVVDSTGSFVRGNLVAGPGTTGIACTDGVPIVTDNRVGGFGVNIQTTCQRSGNVEQIVE